MEVKSYTLDGNALNAKIGDEVIDLKVKFDPDGEIYDSGDGPEIGVVGRVDESKGCKILFLNMSDSKIKRVNVTKDVDCGLCRYRLIR